MSLSKIYVNYAKYWDVKLSYMALLRYWDRTNWKFNNAVKAFDYMMRNTYGVTILNINHLKHTRTQLVKGEIENNLIT